MAAFGVSQGIFIVLLIFSFILWVLFRSVLGDEGMAFWLFWVVKRLAVPCLLAFFILATVEDERDIKRFAYALVGFCVFTAVFGLLQYFTPLEFFWHARTVLGVPPP